MNIAKYIMLMGCTRFASTRVGVSPDTKGSVIANKLLSSRLAGIPVVNESKEVIGVVTEFELLGAFREGMDPETFTAERVMRKLPKTADLDTPAEELIEIMLENNFSMIPITKNNKLAGVVDRCSIMDFYMSPGMERYAG